MTLISTIFSLSSEYVRVLDDSQWMHTFVSIRGLYYCHAYACGVTDLFPVELNALKSRVQDTIARNRLRIATSSSLWHLTPHSITYIKNSYDIYITGINCYTQNSSLL